MGLVANWDEKKFEKLVFRSFVMQIALFMLGIIE
jgi:hypothetical protein